MRLGFRNVSVTRVSQRGTSIHGLNTSTTRTATHKSTFASKLPSQSILLRPVEATSKAAISDGVESNVKSSSAARFPSLHELLHGSRFRWVRTSILAAPTLALALLHCPYEVLTANGQSMAPFINPSSSDGLLAKDKILLQRWHTSSTENGHGTGKEAMKNQSSSAGLKRGQIVVFFVPNNPSKIAVKRVVALPGDMVEPLPGYAGGENPVVVPWNHVWVEGDIGSRKASSDSNWYGPISQNLILGEVIAILTSGLSWHWVNWREHSWPARESHRIHTDVMREAAVDPDAVTYNSGWRDGSIALVLGRIQRQPELMLSTFVNDLKVRQETRRLYNNALYVAEVANSPQEKKLAKNLVEVMEEVYGREALVFGIRMKRKPRDRGELPAAGSSSLAESPIRDQTASEAETWLRKQGWELERHTDGTIKTQISKAT